MQLNQCRANPDQKAVKAKTKLLLATAALLASFAFLSGIESISESMFNTRLFRPKIRDVEVSGVVKDAGTGKPVPQAHVIIVTRTEGIKPGSPCYGLVADNEGRFHASVKSAFYLSPFMSIIASAPNNNYAEIGSKAMSVQHNKLVAKNVTLLAKGLPESDKKVRYRYHTFCPGCPPGQGFTFLDDGWTPVFHD
jgi:hypothetical protein